jgi:hypothetical protein
MARRAKAAGLGPVRKKAALLCEHLPGPPNHAMRAIANAVTGGFNFRTQAAKPSARGFRRFANHRTTILFRCGKPSLYP